MANIEQVFISHCSEEDGQFAHRLADGLQQLGVQVWIAPESIRPGEGWVDAINRGVSESAQVLIVLTPAAVESPWVKKETEVAIALERQGRLEIIPLDVQPCEVPPLWSSYQMISFSHGYDAGFSELVDRLGLSVASPEPAQPLEKPPREALPRVTGPQYAKTHEWARWDGEEIVCGISDHAQESLSDIVYVELPEEGDVLERGDIFGVVESVKAASDLCMPMGGEIVAINEELEDTPELVNQDPYGEGWMIRFTPSDPTEFDDLMTVGEYEAYVTEEEE